MDAALQLWTGFSGQFYSNFIAEKRYMYFVNGLGVTILISVLAIMLGILCGALIYFMRSSRFSVLRGVGYMYVDIFRGTPVVTQLLIFQFVIFGGIFIDPIWVAVIGFGMNSGAYVSEIIRAGVQSIEIGQREAGRSLGLSSRQTMLHIIGPQAIKNIFPTLINEFIVLIKETAVVGYIAVMDLTRAADMATSRTFNKFMPLLAAALIYYILVKLLTFGVSKLEKRLRRSDHR